MLDRKKTLRKRMLARQRLLTEAQKAQAEEDLKKCVSGKRFWQEAVHIGCYISHGNELRTGLLIELAWSQDKCVYVPVVEEAGRKMRFVKYSKGDRLEAGRYVRQPQKCGSEDLSDLCDCFIVPTCGLDNQGYRLGQGLGYYDRFLEHRPWVCSVGVAYQCNKIESIEPEGHDIPCTVKIWI